MSPQIKTEQAQCSVLTDVEQALTHYMDPFSIITSRTNAAANLAV